jgi:hypothetical protein
MPGSESFYLCTPVYGSYMMPGLHWTRDGTVVTVLPAKGAKEGDRIAAHYAYATTW